MSHGAEKHSVGTRYRHDGGGYTSRSRSLDSHARAQAAEFDIPVVKSGRIVDKLLRRIRCQPAKTSKLLCKLDGAFIVTLGENPNLHNICTILTKYAKTVFILATDAARVSKEIRHRQIKIVELPSAYQDTFKCDNNPSTRFFDRFDIPAKRNYALRLSRSEGLCHVGIFDDDLLLLKSHLTKGLVSLANGSDIASLYSLRFPDVSTVDLVRCHLHSENPEVSISGNAMFLNVATVRGFFPYVYNEDWLFFLNNQLIGNRLRGVAVVEQQPRLKVSATRIAFEQFGELIAGGIIRIRANNLLRLPEEVQFWHLILTEYKVYLRRLLAKTEQSTYLNQMLRCAMITTDSFVASDFAAFATEFNKQSNHENTI